MKLHIKNMISERCITIVQQELDKLKIKWLNVDTGIVHLAFSISDDKKISLAIALKECGYELVDNRITILVEQIRNCIIEMINGETLPQINYSAYLVQKLNYDYTYLSNTFSYGTGFTIEQFIIFNKIERAKNYLVSGELTITQIAEKLDYSSSAHLSNQFKKVTGLTPSQFKDLQLKRYKCSPR